MNLKSANPEFSKEVNGSVSNSDEVITPSSGGGVSSAAMAVKEHMFDKVVTPSDVGKLNRLVIPKQYAEKYFPLDSSTNEKGLLLNFEDRNGKPWLFRYSYWSSSQSYVMTKGWSRFVKEKSLDPGDTVSFHRAGKDRFFIDWRCRQDIPAPPQLCFQRQNHEVQPWSTYVLQASYSHFLLQANANITAHHYHPYGNNSMVVVGNPCRPRSVTYSGLAPAAVPVVQGRQAGGKRLRLFGVNMDCSNNSESDDHQSDILSSSNPLPNLSSHSSSIPFIELRQYNTDNYNDHKGKGSMSLDLDI